MSSLKVYLIAGEPSGDLLGSRLMRALKKQTKGNVSFYGVGGETMEQEGLTSLFDITDLAIMGLLEVIPSIPRVLKHMNTIMQDIADKQPDIIITVDSYSFSSRIHKKLKKAGCTIPHVHYVAPQVWAWKKGRAKQVADFMDHLYCLLPTEPGYFTPHGMATTFVGHPVIEGGANQGDAKRFRMAYNIPEDALVVTVLPGSRKTEIKYLAPIFKEAIEKFSAKHPDIFVVLPTVHTVADRAKEALKDWWVPHVIVQGESARYDAFAASNVAVAASGTVSLELAMAGVPHLIAYKVTKMTAWMVRRLIQIKYVNLINILADKEVIPELLQEDCTSDKIAKTMEKLLKEGNPQMRSNLSQLQAKPGQTPSEVMAAEIIALVRKGRKK